MIVTAPPVFRKLEPDECEELLARHHVGRIAYARDGGVDVEPIHYVYSDRVLYGRTSPGTKLDSTGYSWHPVAFEVDEIEHLFRWRSVVVHGGFSTIPFRSSGWEIEEWTRGLELLRTLIPETFDQNDPVPQRTIMFRIAVEGMEGRAAEPA